MGNHGLTISLQLCVSLCSALFSPLFQHIPPQCYKMPPKLQQPIRSFLLQQLPAGSAHEHLPLPIALETRMNAGVHQVEPEKRHAPVNKGCGSPGYGAPGTGRRSVPRSARGNRFERTHRTARFVEFSRPGGLGDLGLSQLSADVLCVVFLF